MKIKNIISTITFVGFITSYSVSQELISKNENCVGIIGVHVGEGAPFEGNVYKTKGDKSSVVNILFSMSREDHKKNNHVNIDGDMNYVYEYAQFYCYETDKKWYKIYLDSPVNSYVWIKKKKRYVTYYTPEDVKKYQESRDMTINLPCNND